MTMRKPPLPPQRKSGQANSKTEDALRAAQDTRNKADKQIGVLETRADALEQALTDAQTKEKSSLNTLTATRAAIRQLREQLKTGADADLDELSAKLHIQGG